MKKNKIEEHKKGFVVIPQWDEVDRMREAIDQLLMKSEISGADALTALCLVCIETAYHSKVQKPQFLSKISGWWEELDHQAQKDT